VNISVNVTKRVTTPEGQRFFPVVGSNNGRIKPDWVWIDDKEVRCPSGTYYIDYTDSSGKRVRTSVGSVAAEAQAARLRKEAELRALAQGLNVVPEEGDSAKVQKRSIALAVVDFLDEVKLTKDPKTYKGYEIALAYFQESCPKVYLETLERKDLLKFAAFLKTTKKQSPRSVHNKFACLLTFLSVNGLPKLVGKSDRPKFVKQEVEIFEHGELESLFKVCSPYHLTIYNFLLMTGLREQEAMYCVWNDVNLKAGTINMRWKPQYDFAPKAYREREVPIPTKLVETLRAFRPKNARDDSLVFCTASGRPDTHMLRALKRNAVRAGLDPNRYWLHKFRATFATMHLAAGVDLRTVQAWLGHTNLESTIRYLKPARGEAMRDKVNATFA
jgi:integrase/recombinase XerD